MTPYSLAPGLVVTIETVLIAIAVAMDIRSRRVPPTYLLVFMLAAGLLRWLMLGDPLGALMIVSWTTATYGRNWFYPAVALTTIWCVMYPVQHLAPAILWLTFYILFNREWLLGADYVITVSLAGLMGDIWMPVFLMSVILVRGAIAIALPYGLSGIFRRMKEVVGNSLKGTEAVQGDEQAVKGPYLVVVGVAALLHFWIWPGNTWWSLWPGG